MRKRLAPTGVGKSASLAEARSVESPCPGMSGIFPAQINSAPPSRGSPVSEGRWVQDEQVAAMTDEEMLALYRQTRTNPYLTLSTAKALHGLELKFGYLRAEPEPWKQRQDPEAN